MIINKIITILSFVIRKKKYITTDLGCDKKSAKPNITGVSLLTTPSDSQVSGELSIDRASKWIYSIYMNK